MCGDVSSMYQTGYTIGSNQYWISIFHIHTEYFLNINCTLFTQYHGKIWPICAESAVKPQPTNLTQYQDVFFKIQLQMWYKSVTKPEGLRRYYISHSSLFWIFNRATTLLEIYITYPIHLNYTLLSALVVNYITILWTAKSWDTSMLSVLLVTSSKEDMFYLASVCLSVCLLAR